MRSRLRSLDPGSARFTADPSPGWLLMGLAFLGAGCGGSAGQPPSGDGGPDAAVQPGRDAALVVPLSPGRVDWSHAGYPGDIPDLPDPGLDVTAQGATCDGASDDQPAIQAAMDVATPPAVIRLPAGTCRLESPLELPDGVVLRGAGAAATSLECRSSSGCLSIQGAPDGDYVALGGDLSQDATRIQVSDTAGFVVGGGAEIRQENYIPPSADWGDHDVGQMVEVIAIEGDTLTIHPPLHLQYALDRVPQARPIRFVRQVGVEDLTLRRLDSGLDEGGNNVDVRRAADCWMRRVESDYTEKYHVSISESLHVEVRDSYLHDARSKGDGGQGYGVSLARYATSVLVENNIFRETRHAMIIQLGASGNVFGYNYAERNYSDDGWDKAYVSLHGHYPFMNLWESNLVGLIAIGDYWGPVGPGNTFLRNRVLGTDRHASFGVFRGIELGDYSGTQYLVGNEVLAEGIYGELHDVVLWGNDESGEVIWSPEVPDHTIPASYYLGARPPFYGEQPWPSLGGDHPTAEPTLPALQRWMSGSPVPPP